MLTQSSLDPRCREMDVTAFRGPGSLDSIKGDYEFECKGGSIDARMHRRTIGPSSIVKVHARAAQSFTRSLSHIREDPTDLAILCFVRRGRLRLEHGGGVSVAKREGFIAAKSIVPFSLTCDAGQDDTYEATHVIVPTHILREHLRDEMASGLCISARCSRLSVAERLILDLADGTGDLGDSAERYLFLGALAAIAEAIRHPNMMMSRRPSRTDMHARAILRQIEIHLSDSTLNTQKVARNSGISVRHLASILKSKGTTFSSIVWSKRLQVAEHWLSTSDATDVTIDEISRRAGFKSSAHFSRMFRRTFNASPRDYREMHGSRLTGIRPPPSSRR